MGSEVLVSAGGPALSRRLAVVALSNVFSVADIARSTPFGHGRGCAGGRRPHYGRPATPRMAVGVQFRLVGPYPAARRLFLGHRNWGESPVRAAESARCGPAAPRGVGFPEHLRGAAATRTPHHRGSSWHRSIRSARHPHLPGTGEVVAHEHRGRRLISLWVRGNCARLRRQVQ